MSRHREGEGPGECDALGVATTRDHDAFSYFDIWTDTAYTGAVRVRDRLMGFDIFGSTLVTLVERTPGADGIGERAIDWYDLGEVVNTGGSISRFNDGDVYDVDLVVALPTPPNDLRLTRLTQPAH